MSFRNETVRKVFVALLTVAGLMAVPAARAYQLSGPILGYVADPMTSALRVINGIPGASVIGESVSPDLKIRKAAVSIRNDYALAVTTDGADVILITDLSGARSVSPIPGVYNGGDTLALSPDGSSAVVYSASNFRLQIIGGLPSSPAVRFEVDTAAAAQGGVSAVAINSNQEILVAFSGGETGTLYLFAADTAARFIAGVGNVSGITFSAGGDRAVIADRSWNQVVLFQDLSTTATPIYLAGSVDGISSPLGILLSEDAKTAYVANAGSGTVTLVNLAGGAAQDVSCACTPTGIQVLEGASVFALTERSDEPIVLFDGGSTDPRFLLVPANIPTPE